MSTVDVTILAIDTYCYLWFIFVVVYYHKDWDGILGYKSEKEIKEEKAKKDKIK